MNKTLKQFSLLLVFVFSAVFADSKADLENYRLFVTEVDPEFHCFRLSNKLVFNIPKKDWETETLPEVGTEVQIWPRFINVFNRHPFAEDDFNIVFYKNPDKKLMSVCLPKESEEYCLTQVSAEAICIAPAGWFLPAKYHYIMTLSDGSRWIFEKESIFHRGNRVILSKFEESEFLILNIDQSECIPFLSGWVYKACGKIKPYDPEEITKE